MELRIGVQLRRAPNLPVVQQYIVFVLELAASFDSVKQVLLYCCILSAINTYFVCTQTKPTQWIHPRLSFFSHDHIISYADSIYHM